MRKDIEFTIEDVSYVIRNVPYYPEDNYSEETIGLGVAIKLEMIRELMYENKIPHDIDYVLVEDIKF